MMSVEVVVGLSNLGEEGRPDGGDLAFDPLLSREAAEKVIAAFRHQGLRPPAATLDDDGRQWSLRSSLARANVCLASMGLPTHAEPAEVPPWQPPVPVVLPLDALHRLRRVMAHQLVWPGQPVEPLDLGADARADPVMAEVRGRLDNHLLHHADAEGFFLPVSFSQVVHDPSGTILDGGWLGSSQRLGEEMHEVAPLLEIEPGPADPAEPLPAALVERVERERLAGSAFALERWAWLLHAAAARQSLRDGAAVVYR